MVCPACGRQTSTRVERYHYRESGLDNVFVEGVELFNCSCGQEYVQLPGAQRVHDHIASQLLNKTSLLTGAEAKFLRKWLHLTSDGMAKALGHTRVTVSRWENDKPSVANDRMLRLYAAQVGKVSVDFPQLFESMTDKPQKQFKIIVEDTASRLPQFTAPSANIVKSSHDKHLFNFQAPLDVVAVAANQELALAA